MRETRFPDESVRLGVVPGPGSLGQFAGMVVAAPFSVTLGAMVTGGKFKLIHLNSSSCFGSALPFGMQEAVLGAGHALCALADPRYRIKKMLLSWSVSAA